MYQIMYQAPCQVSRRRCLRVRLSVRVGAGRRPGRRVRAAGRGISDSVFSEGEAQRELALGDNNKFRLLAHRASARQSAIAHRHVNHARPGRRARARRRSGAAAVPTTHQRSHTV